MLKKYFIVLQSVFMVVLMVGVKAQKLETLNDFSTKKVFIFREGLGILDLETRVVPDQKMIEIDLPDGIDSTQIVATSDRQGSGIERVEMVYKIIEKEKNVQSNRDILIANVGNFVEIEAIEGVELINYEGKIKPLDPESEVLLLENDSTVNAIVLRNISNVSMGKNGNFTKIVSQRKRKLVIYFKDNAAQTINLKLGISDLRFRPNYELTLNEKNTAPNDRNDNFRGNATLTNLYLDLKNTNIELIDGTFEASNMLDMSQKRFSKRINFDFMPNQTVGFNCFDYEAKITVGHRYENEIFFAEKPIFQTPTPIGLANDRTTTTLDFGEPIDQIVSYGLVSITNSDELDLPVRFSIISAKMDKYNTQIRLKSNPNAFNLINTMVSTTEKMVVEKENKGKSIFGNDTKTDQYCNKIDLNIQNTTAVSHTFYHTIALVSNPNNQTDRLEKIRIDGTDINSMTQIEIKGELKPNETKTYIIELFYAKKSY